MIVRVSKQAGRRAESAHSRGAPLLLVPPRAGRAPFSIIASTSRRLRSSARLRASMLTSYCDDWGVAGASSGERRERRQRLTA